VKLTAKTIVSQGLTATPLVSTPLANFTKGLIVRPVPLHPCGICCARTRGATPRTSKLARTATRAAASLACAAPTPRQSRVISLPPLLGSACPPWAGTDTGFVYHAWQVV